MAIQTFSFSGECPRCKTQTLECAISIPEGLPQANIDKMYEDMGTVFGEILTNSCYNCYLLYDSNKE